MKVTPPPVRNLALPAGPLKGQISLMPLGEVGAVTPLFHTIPTMVITVIAVVQANDHGCFRGRGRGEKHRSTNRCRQRERTKCSANHHCLLSNPQRPPRPMLLK